MNIFGEGLSKNIKYQVLERQKIYGSGYTGIRKNEELLYLNNNNAWCKLVSSVDIKNIDIINNPTVKNIGLQQDLLARQFILFNGTADYAGEGLRAGISEVNQLYNANNVYGIGGTEFGLRPMMGIISANINHENRGSLRTAVVKLKAFNRAQFEIIDILYLRLGYSVLLEWGNSMYFDNLGEFFSNPNNMSLANDFLDGNETYSNFLNKIHNQRLQLYGNYDAMFAKVTNFHWSFQKDGSYDITLNLSSAGDIIESLNVNVLLNKYQISSKTNSPQTNEELESKDIKTLTAAWSKINTIGEFLNFLGINTEINSYFSINGTTKINSPFNAGYFDPNIKDSICIEYDGDDIGKRYYVRLGTFLNFLQNFIIPSIKTKSGIDKALLFDWDMNTNLMNINPIQVGTYPKNCVVNRKIKFKDDSDFTTFIGIGEEFINYDITNIVKTSDNIYGNIMNIYVDFEFIINVIRTKQDDKGNLSLIDFLQSILNGINEGLGGISDLDVFLDETINTIKIIDKNPIKNLDEVITYINSKITDESKKVNINDYTFKFDLYGYNIDKDSTVHASFIKDFSFATEITPQLSTMITVGAAANGTVVGENDTALTKLNRGLEDRFKNYMTNTLSLEELKNVSIEKQHISEDLKNAFIEAEVLYKNTYNNYIEFLMRLAKDKLENGDIDNYKFTLKSLLQYYSNKVKAAAEYNKAKYNNSYIITQGTGFIPFNLSLVMDGLSGMKINQQFGVDTDFLPSNYPQTVRFLIKNMKHEIKDNKWETKLESYCIAKHDDTIQKEDSPIINDSTQQKQNSSSTAVVEKGTDADLWSLIAIAAAENYIDTPQGMADVAQSIYNRLKAGYAKSIKEVIIAPGQYEPTFRNPSDWFKIKDKDTAIIAYQNTRHVSLAQATQAINISYNALTNPVYKNNAKIFIGSRTEFLAAAPTSPLAVGMVERSPALKHNTFYWRYKGRDVFYLKGILNAQSPPSNLTQLA